MKEIEWVIKEGGNKAQSQMLLTKEATTQTATVQIILSV